VEHFTPAPGVHREVAYADYHRWEAASNSRLTLLAQSPAHLKAYLDGYGRGDTPATLLGRAIHTAVLEPDTFDSRYIIAEQCTANTKDGAQCKNMGLNFTALGWRCGIAAHNKDVPISLVSDKVVISPEDRTTCVGIRDSVYAHPAAKALLAGITPQSAELSLVWNDPDTGILCKARPDYCTEAIAGGALVDLKSTIDASKRGFERAIFQHGYHRQGVHYLDGAEENQIDVAHFIFIACEKVYPFAAAVYRMRDDVVVWGRQDIQPLRRRYAACLDSGLYPAYSDQVEDIALPPYAYGQIEEAIANGVA
jgi:hypothetical protein